MIKEIRIWDRTMKTMEYGNMYELSPTGAQDEVVMQGTGKTDRANNDLYDGDLVRNDTGRMGKICWFKHGARWDVTAVNAMGEPGEDFDPVNWERKVLKVGNIWENPEILERKIPPYRGVATQ